MTDKRQHNPLRRPVTPSQLLAEDILRADSRIVQAPSDLRWRRHRGWWPTLLVFAIPAALILLVALRGK